MLSGLILTVGNDRLFFSFNPNSMSWCIYSPRLFVPSFSRTLYWFPILGSYEQHCSDHGSTDVSLAFWFHSVLIYAQSRNARSYGSPILNIFKRISILISKRAILIYQPCNSMCTGGSFSLNSCQRISKIMTI